MTEHPNCPFCNSEFGQTPEFMFGCTNYKCPELPRYHDPVGRPDYVDDFWEAIIENAAKVKAQKRYELTLLQEQVDEYYYE